MLIAFPFRYNSSAFDTIYFVFFFFSTSLKVNIFIEKKQKKKLYVYSQLRPSGEKKPALIFVQYWLHGFPIPISFF